MQKTNDIANLFRQFGAAPNTYREITRQQQSQEASTRWPLLSQIQSASTDVVPPVQAHEQLPATAARHTATPPPSAATMPVPVPAPALTSPAPQIAENLWAAKPAVEAVPLHEPHLPPQWNNPAPNVRIPTAPEHSASPLSRLARRTDMAAPPQSKPVAATEDLQEIFNRLGHLAPPSTQT